jgi:Glycosyl hydrolases family 16
MASAFRTIFFSFILLWSFPGRVAASPLEEASAIMEKGDPATARLLRPLAYAKGVIEAIYEVGRGVLLDEKWRKAAERGNAFARFKLDVQPGTSATLLWSEEFNSLDLASKSNPNGLWRPNSFWQDISLGYLDFAGQSWNVNPNTATFAPYNPFSISNGVLRISVLRTPAALNRPILDQMAAQRVSAAVPAWCGGFLISNPTVHKWKYGYFEIRARWPNPGRGMFPALWFYATDGATDPLGKGTAEIDMAELYGAPSKFYTTLQNTVGQLGVANKDTTDWHTYGMDWQPTYIRFYYDSQLLYEVAGTNATWYNTTMGIVLNFSMDARWFAAHGLQSDASTPSPMFSEVDYVRIWDKMPKVVGGGGWQQGEINTRLNIETPH